MKKALSALAIGAALLTGCGAGGGSAPKPTPAPVLQNPTGFPLYAGASVISSKRFVQRVRVESGTGGSAYAQGSGTYAGEEVIASSSAAFSTLARWVDALNAAPPPGYLAEEPQSNADESAQSARIGLQYAAFRRKNGTKTQGVVVIVMDPQRVNRRFGAILGLVAKYRALPGFLRSPLDDEAKSRFGMTITQATQPGSPVGAALGALSELAQRKERGIIVLQAQKV